ncbi:MAG TPA: transcription termination factor [Candidatus Coprenecus pullistercoris]|nr:transcription termination factor [Candidatus Coprenecus pullistercoris]
MLNRRLIRIKVFKVLYSVVTSGSDSVKEAEKTLMYSCEKTLHLYYFILNAAVALQNAAENRIETGLKKFNPSPEERNPNRKFAENQVSAYLGQDPRFMKYCADHGLVWTEDLAVFVKKLFNAVSAKEYFKEYMETEARSMAQDCDLFIKIFSDPELFEDNEDLESFLEDMSMFWIDDLGYVLNVIVRNLELLRHKGSMPLPDVFLKDDDREFAVELLRAAMAGYDKYMDIVVSNTSNWDPDRVVTTDLVLIVQGVAEAVRFPNIPLKVTINEYVDISKFYSTNNSKVFVNGLLDRILRKMVDTGDIVKSGRGLIDN